MRILEIVASIKALRPNCDDYVYVSPTVCVGLAPECYVVTDYDPNAGTVTHEIKTSSSADAACVALDLIRGQRRPNC